MKTAEEMLLEANSGNLLGGRKLTFTEQCGAFAALYGGQRNAIVARAFGISLQTTSKLSGCLEIDPDPYRYVAQGDDTSKVLMDHNRNRKFERARFYPAVAREFEALGKEEFNSRYYTERVHNRILLAKQQLRDEAKS